MCKVKEGANVTTNADLQNLVTSVILRQTSTFSLPEICQIIMAKLSGSIYQNKEEIEKCCEETISTLYSIDCLKSTKADQYKLSMSFPSAHKK